MKPTTKPSTASKNHHDMDYDESFSDNADMDEDLSFRTLDSMTMHLSTARKPKHPSTIVGNGFSFYKIAATGELNDERIRSWHSTTASCSDASSDTYYSISETEDFDGIGILSSSIADIATTSKSSFLAAMTSSKNAEHDKIKIDQYSLNNGSNDSLGSCLASPNRQALNLNSSMGRSGRISPRNTQSLGKKISSKEAPFLKSAPDLSCVHSVVSPNMTTFPSPASATATNKTLLDH